MDTPQVLEPSHGPFSLKKRPIRIACTTAQMKKLDFPLALFGI
jgi:hypothetical protein